MTYDLWAGIINTDGAINSIADGRLPTVIKFMKDGGIRQDWKLQKIIDVFNDKKIPVDKWEQILGEVEHLLQ